MLQNENARLKKELADREGEFKMDLLKKERGFQSTLLGLVDHWEAKEQEWSKKRERERELENKDKFNRYLSDQMEMVKKELEVFKINLAVARELSGI